MKSLENFARNLRRLRNERKLSQEELGFQVGMHRTSINNLESRRHSPSLKNMARIAEALGVKVDDLIQDPE
ncbi:helix-turn-helix transcriptional regulator [Pseudaminobacter soli (ex Li et al. 2025)]|uniref:Transcriptional regulator n=1 Tax=Pseudaminobacter soli (ex Li et al. 2025) TaxID=1295366 RepID=A0A2P7S557_9HYPH|nr:helix-turn-helix transcriptional regulator [Mesorhizobium soli]PSJ57600.1 transcriptional regulator [Mesorhizobium soli]